MPKNDAPQSPTNEIRHYFVSVPVAPPAPPEGYTVMAYRVVDNPDTSRAHDLMDDWVGSGRFRNPAARLDWELAIRTYAEHGIKACNLEVEAECEVIEAGTDEGGSYTAVCWWQAEKGLDGEWSAWFNSSDMQQPAVTVEQMREYGSVPKAQHISLAEELARR